MWLHYRLQKHSTKKHVYVYYLILFVWILYIQIITITENYRSPFKNKEIQTVTK